MGRSIVATSFVLEGVVVGIVLGGGVRGERILGAWVLVDFAIARSKGMPSEMVHSAIMVDDLGIIMKVWIDGEAVVGMVSFVGGLVDDGRNNVAAEAGLMRRRTDIVGGGITMKVRTDGEAVVGMVSFVGGLVGDGRDDVAAEAGVMRR